MKTGLNVHNNINNTYQLLEYACVLLHLVIIITVAGKLKKCQPVKLNISQKLILAAAFANNCYINPTKIMEVGQQTGLTEKRVRDWLAKRRWNIRHERRRGTFLQDDKTGIQPMI